LPVLPKFQSAPVVSNGVDGLAGFALTGGRPCDGVEGITYARSR